MGWERKETGTETPQSSEKLSKRKRTTDGVYKGQLVGTSQRRKPDWDLSFTHIYLFPLSLGVTAEK